MRRSWRRDRVVAALTVSLLAAACSGSSSATGWAGSENGMQPGSEGALASLDPPTDLEAELLDSGPDELMMVSFAPSPGAEAHLLDLGDDSGTTMVETADCLEDECRLLLDRLSTSGATELTVTAVAGAGRSEPSDPVELPEWAGPPAAREPDGSEPATLVVARGGSGQPLALSTEEVAAAEVEDRMTALYLEPDVVGVEIQATAHPLEDEGDDDRPDLGVHEGTYTWQEAALDVSRLPPEPRGRGVTVAVIDSGVWVDHPVFEGASIETVNVREPGADVVPGNHGTSVTSMIVGQPGSRVPGIASGATIRAYDVQTGGEGADTGDIAAAIIAAVDDGADVINVSMAYGCNRVWPLPTHFNCPPDVLGAAAEYAEEHGVVVVAGAGNNGPGDGCTDWHGHGPNADQWPAKFPTVVAVGGTTRAGDVWRCSPDTSYIDVLAPAAGLRAALGPESPHGEYGTVSGTSYASPLVAGLVAVLLAEQPELTPADVRAMLRGSTAENGRLLPGMLMAEIGVLPPGTLVVDPTTQQAAHRYTLELQFRPGHPVQEAARAIEDSWMVPSLQTWWEVVGLGPAVWGPVGGESTVHLTVVGTFFVDEEGVVTGYGSMEGIGNENNHSYSALTGNWSGDVGHIIRCPNVGVPRPYVAFMWDVPASVGGHLTSEEYRTEIDMSLSLGLGSTADQPGEVPPMTTLHDNLDECEGTLAAGVSRGDYGRVTGVVWSDLCRDRELGDCVSAVHRARNDLAVLTEELYAAIIESVGTLEFRGSLGGFEDGTGTLYAQGAEWEDPMYAVLSIGV